jgi:deuterolysin
MKTAAIFSALLGLASAAAVDLTKRASPLDVKVEQLGNTGFKASITNTGDSALRVLKTGSILDSAPVEKARISQNGKLVQFLHL